MTGRNEISRVKARRFRGLASLQGSLCGCPEVGRGSPVPLLFGSQHYEKELILLSETN